MSWSTIIQLILAIPKLIGFIRDLVSLIDQGKIEADRKKQEALLKAIAAEEAAKSKAEKWKAHEDVTSNLP